MGGTQFSSEQVAIFILDKPDFRTKKTIRNIEKHYLMKKGSILQDDVCVCLTTVSMYVRQELIELCNNIDKSAIIVGDISAPYQQLTDPGGRKSVRV